MYGVCGYGVCGYGVCGEWGWEAQYTSYSDMYIDREVGSNEGLICVFARPYMCSRDLIYVVLQMCSLAQMKVLYVCSRARLVLFLSIEWD